uniref:TRP C-terminal domain-containing protein n=1 Tax=Chromera velia CCMP2878 TaxID=1169474 RepID=A0A0G4FWH1_9ALVE|eukprot:Cvel_19127.t1-p1 / transcript=Cvel_19127.t1 / gene=Cvel_19127 / organism=Chromera_velia_CCMP2878 / gene_product=hypothetical protein / transcript_product=hypothetical protein / location=Cvel_scaffold1625:25377-32625(-) / protein_length=1296 / sequence_SO=supercontig / SO=protein_coding / is_pseudo=false
MVRGFPDALIVPCPIEGSCANATQEGMQEEEPQMTCGEGMTGPLCDECKVRYYQLSPDQPCVACPPEKSQWISAAVILVVLTLVMMGYAALVVSDSASDTETHKVALKILLNFLRIFGILQTFNFAAPRVTRPELEEAAPYLAKVLIVQSFSLSEMLPIGSLPTVDSFLAVECLVDFTMPEASTAWRLFVVRIIEVHVPFFIYFFSIFLAVMLVFGWRCSRRRRVPLPEAVSAKYAARIRNAESSAGIAADSEDEDEDDLSPGRSPSRSALVGKENKKSLRVEGEGTSERERDGVSGQKREDRWSSWMKERAIVKQRFELKALAEKRLFRLFRFVFSKDMGFSKRLRIILDDSLAVATIIFFFSFEQLVQDLIDTVRCEAFDDGMDLRLTARRSVLCNTGAVRAIGGMAFAFVVMYAVVLPGVLAAFIAIQRGKLLKQITSTSGSVAVGDGENRFQTWGLTEELSFLNYSQYFNSVRVKLIQFYRAFSIFLGGYKDTFFYWEIVVMARKFTAELAVAFNPTSDPKSRLWPLLCHSVFFLVLQLSFQPYNEEANNILNRLESWSLIVWTSLLLLLTGMMYNDLDIISITLIYTVMWGLTVYFVVWAVWVLVRGFLLEIEKKYKNLDQTPKVEMTMEQLVVHTLRLHKFLSSFIGLFTSRMKEQRFTLDSVPSPARCWDLVKADKKGALVAYMKNLQQQKNVATMSHVSLEAGVAPILFLWRQPLFQKAGILQPPEGVHVIGGKGRVGPPEMIRSAWRETPFMWDFLLRVSIVLTHRIKIRVPLKDELQIAEHALELKALSLDILFPEGIEEGEESGELLSVALGLFKGGGDGLNQEGEEEVNAQRELRLDVDDSGSGAKGEAGTEIQSPDSSDVEKRGDGGDGGNFPFNSPFDLERETTNPLISSDKEAENEKGAAVGESARPQRFRASRDTTLWTKKETKTVMVQDPNGDDEKTWASETPTSGALRKQAAELRRLLTKQKERGLSKRDVSVWRDLDAESLSSLEKRLLALLGFRSPESPEDIEVSPSMQREMNLDVLARLGEPLFSHPRILKAEGRPEESEKEGEEGSGGGKKKTKTKGIEVSKLYFGLTQLALVSQSLLLSYLYVVYLAAVLQRVGSNGGIVLSPVEALESSESLLEMQMEPETETEFVSENPWGHAEDGGKFEASDKAGPSIAFSFPEELARLVEMNESSGDGIREKEGEAIELEGIEMETETEDKKKKEGSEEKEDLDLDKLVVEVSRAVTKDDQPERDSKPIEKNDSDVPNIPRHEMTTQREKRPNPKAQNAPSLLGELGMD